MNTDRKNIIGYLQIYLANWVKSNKYPSSFMDINFSYENRKNLIEKITTLSSNKDTLKEIDESIELDKKIVVYIIGLYLYKMISHEIYEGELKSSRVKKPRVYQFLNMVLKEKSQDRICDPELLLAILTQNPRDHIEDKIATDNYEIELFSTVGLTLDVADIIVIGEYTVRNIKDSIFTEDTISYYGTLGYRMGNFTPHVTYSVLETEFRDSNAPVFNTNPNTNTNPTPNVPIATVGFFRSALSTDSETVTAGLRYEINSKTALKLEYQNLNKSPQETDPRNGQLTREETHAELYKIALSVIF